MPTEDFLARPARTSSGSLFRLYLHDVGFTGQDLENLRVGDLLELVILDRFGDCPKW